MGRVRVRTTAVALPHTISRWSSGRPSLTLTFVS